MTRAQSATQDHAVRGVQKAISDNLLYLEDHVSHANAMTTLTSPSLAAVTACLAPV